MADSVQHALDRMVADLDDLRYRGIFSEAEVRVIVAKRKEFEYLLRRVETRKVDFMRYVEYETNLDSLCWLRNRRAAGDKKIAFSLSNTSFARGVRSIFERAVVRFPADVDLWLEFIQFVAQRGQTKVLSRLFARALQLHPRNAGLWIKAASWEFFEGGNTSSARALMQRSLRINPGARELWLQYFRLEFFYVEKLRGRREVLGLEGNAEDAEQQHADDGDQETSSKGIEIPQLKEECQGDEPSFEAMTKASKVTAADSANSASSGSKGGANKSMPRKQTVVMNQTARRFYQGAVPLAVYRAAIKAVPDDVEFRASFLRSCLQDFPELGGDVAKAVLDSITKGFPKSCEAWEIRGSYPMLLAGGSCLQGMTSAECPLGPVLTECVKVFEQAVRATTERGPEMWVRYARFLRRVLEEVGSSTQRDRKRGAGGKCGRLHLAPFAGKVASHLREVLSRAVSIHLKVKTSAARGVEGNLWQSAEARIGSHRELGKGEIENAEAVEDSRDADREALALGLADVCLALGDYLSALETLVWATEVLPGRPSPWLRRASLERRMQALTEDDTSRESSLERGGNSRCRENDAGACEGEVTYSRADAGMDTLRKGLRSVPPADPRYPMLWRELIAFLLANGTEKKDMEKAFRAAAEACAPTGADAGLAQGELLRDYVRWCGAVDGLEAAHRAMQWAKKSFVLAGIGAAQAYVALLELEQNLGGVSDGAEGDEGARSTKRIRDLFEELTSRFGHDVPRFWDQYAQFELNSGDLKRANAVRSRAQKAAANPSGAAPKRQRRR